MVFSDSMKMGRPVPLRLDIGGLSFYVAKAPQIPSNCSDLHFRFEGVRAWVLGPSRVQALAIKCGFQSSIYGVGHGTFRMHRV